MWEKWREALSAIFWKKSEPDENSSSEPEDMSPKRTKSKHRRMSTASNKSSSRSSDDTQPEGSSSASPAIIRDQDEDEEFWKLPNFGVMMTEAPDSTPENRKYNLDAGILLAYARWGLQRKVLGEVKYLVPLPWKPDVQYNTMEQYVDIEIELLDRSGQRPKRMVPSVRNFWDALESEGKDNRPRHFMIRGEAGSGKTTLCRWFLYSWAKEKQLVDRLNFKDTIIIYYDLRNLKPEDDLDTELLKKLHANSTLGPGDSSLTSRSIRYYHGEMVLMLDSYDSVPENMRQKVRDVMRVANSKNKAFFIATIWIISRFETDRDILYLFDRQFKLKGFTKENVANFLSKHVGSDLPKVMAKIQKYEIEKVFEFVGLAPVTILLLVDELKDAKDLDGQYDIFFRVVVALVRRSNISYKLDLDDTKILQNVYRLGEWFRICSMIDETSFGEEEFIKSMGSHYKVVARIGVLKKRINPPLCMDIYLEPLHIMYWKVIESYYIRERWLSRSDAAERRQFMEQFKTDLKASVIVFVYRLERETSRVCVRIVGANSNVCFDWTIVNGNIVKFAVNLEPYKEYEGANECFRINVEFEESKYANAERLMDTIQSFTLAPKDCDANQKILHLLCSFPQKRFIVSFSDCTVDTNNNTSQTWKILETVPVTTNTENAEHISFDDILFNSSLSQDLLRLQVTVGRPWTTAKHCDIILRQSLNIETTLEESDENVHMYLHGILTALTNTNPKATLILKFKDATSNYTVIINKEPNKVLVCDTVYCTVIHAFTPEELLNNKEAFFIIKWKNCYKISLNCTMSKLDSEL